MAMLKVGDWVESSSCCAERERVAGRGIVVGVRPLRVNWDAELFGPRVMRPQNVRKVEG